MKFELNFAGIAEKLSHSSRAKRGEINVQWKGGRDHIKKKSSHAAIGRGASVLFLAEDCLCQPEYAANPRARGARTGGRRKRKKDGSGVGLGWRLARIAQSDRVGTWMSIPIF